MNDNQENDASEVSDRWPATDGDEYGFTAKPARYSRCERETVDLIRDELGDDGFHAWCHGQELKYACRGETTDLPKEEWYREMRASLLDDRVLDPRHRRVDYEPYVRQTRADCLSVLDHGSIRLVESWGHGDGADPEAGIIEAARQGNFRGWSTETRLLEDLYANKHTGPFEFAGATFEVRLPIFVAEQWHQHRAQSRSEMSARYGPLPEEAYIPTVERGMHGNQYTQMRASANLHNWLRFLALRDDRHAQWEIRQYAAALRELLTRHFPKTLACFNLVRSQEAQDEE